MPRILGTAALVLSASLTIACDSHRESRSPGVPDTGARDDRAQFEEPGALRFGWRGAGKDGGGFSVSIGRDFGPAQAEEVLKRLVALDSSGAFKKFSCGDSVPHFGFDLTLHQQGELQERLVTLGHMPDIEPWGRPRCLHQGFHYLVARTFAQVDSGPSVDYGYRNPSTGKEIPADDPGERHWRRLPICQCELIGKTDDWVGQGPVEISIGGNAH